MKSKLNNGLKNNQTQSIFHINSATKEHFKEYASNSTIHGLRYLSERERPVAEKIWWIIVFVISIALCILFIGKIYTKWTNDPVIVSFAEKATPIWEIPFPAITVCPGVKTDKRIFNFSRVYDALDPDMMSELGFIDEDNYTATDEDLYHMESISHICQKMLFNNFSESNFENLSSEKHVEDLYNIALQMNETIYFISYNEDWIEKHDTIITELITDEGVCLNFNLLKSSDIFKEIAVQNDYEFIPNREQKILHWNLDDGYTKVMGEDFYPYRAQRNGVAGGIEMLVRMDVDDLDYRCQFLSMPGFKVFIHSPTDFPAFTKQTFTIHLNKEINVNIIPQKGIISEGLKNYSPERRNCYLTDERDLFYFRKYTKSNCELECLSNYTLYRCGCVKFSMPRTKSTPICGIPNIVCYNEAIKTFETMLFRGGDNNVTSQCNCLAGCNYVKYDYTYVETDYELSKFANITSNAFNPNYENVMKQHFTLLKVFFQDHDLIASIRSERYGLVDFISNCGGLLGLFMGVSILSFIEILFYCTIRLICNYMRRMQLLKTKPLNVVDETANELYDGTF